MSAKAPKITRNRKNRTKSMDSVQSISSEAEKELLRSDDDEDMSIEMLQTEQATSGGQIDNNQLFTLLTDIKKNQSTKQDIKSLKKVFDGKFAAVENELGAHKSRFTSIEHQLSQLNNKYTALSYERELQKQTQLKNNISIIGCAKSDNENVTHTALNVLKMFGCEFAVTDISTAYRTAGAKPNFSAIIVKFVDFKKKLLALNAKTDSPPEKVYVNNHVTPYFGRLLAAGRQAIKNKLIHSCWIGSYGCLIKQKEDGKAVNIRSINDFVAMGIDVNEKPTKRSRNDTHSDDITIPTQSKPKRTK